MLIILILLILPILSVWIIFAQPTVTSSVPSRLTLQNSRLKAHVVKFSKDCYPRSHTNTQNLDRCAEYIISHFKAAGAHAALQEFTVLGKKYQNVIGFFGNDTAARIVVRLSVRRTTFAFGWCCSAHSGKTWSLRKRIMSGLSGIAAMHSGAP